MDGVSDDNDLLNIGQISDLVNTTSSSKDLGFSECDIYSMVDSLDNWSIMNMDIHYRGGNLILNTSVGYNNSRFQIC